MSESSCAGKNVGLHFMAMEYLLQGPPRTINDLREQMNLSHNQPHAWMKQMVYQRLMSEVPRDMKCNRLGTPEYSPNKVIVDRAEYNELRKRCGLPAV